MQHRLEGDAVAGGFALGLALLGVFDALDAQLAPVLAHVAETVGQRYVIVLGIAISTAAIGLTERVLLSTIPHHERRAFAKIDVSGHW